MVMDKFAEIRTQQYPVLKSTVYLDTATTGLIPRDSYHIFLQMLEERYQRAMDISEYFSHWSDADATREIIARAINADSSEIVFGLSSSALSNIFSNGVKIRSGANVVTYDTVYASLSYPWLNKETEGVELRMASSVNGSVDCRSLFDLVDENTVAINVCHVDMSNGFRHDLKRIGAFCKEKGIWLCVDATQSAGAMHIDVRKMNISFLSASSYKWMQNILGVGFAYVSSDLQKAISQPNMGWANTKQRDHDDPSKFTISDSASRFEDGGQCFLGIAGLANVLKQYLSLGKQDVEDYVLSLAEYLYHSVKQLGSISVYGGYDPEHRSNIVCLSVPEDFHITTALCRENGIRINMIAPDRMRVSLHYYNTQEDIDRLISFLKTVEMNNPQGERGEKK